MQLKCIGTDSTVHTQFTKIKNWIINHWKIQFSQLHIWYVLSEHNYTDTALGSITDHHFTYLSFPLSSQLFQITTSPTSMTKCLLLVFITAWLLHHLWSRNINGGGVVQTNKTNSLLFMTWISALLRLFEDQDTRARLLLLPLPEHQCSLFSVLGWSLTPWNQRSRPLLPELKRDTN